jgi:hypothetical protein
MTRLKYLDPSDGQYKLLPVGAGGASSDEVTISAVQPTAPTNELWVDTTRDTPPQDWTEGDSRYLLSGFRNAVRNGDMSIAQRGDGPFTSAVAGYYIDGWRKDSAGGGTKTMNRVRAAPGELLGGGYWLQHDLSGMLSTDGFFVRHSQYIESVYTFSGSTVTLSFVAKADQADTKIGLEIVQYFGSGGSPSSSVSTPLGAVTVTTTAARYSVTFNVPSISGKTLGTNGNDALRLFLWLSAASDLTQAGGIGIQNRIISITDVQLEAGSLATPFERLPVQQQLAWCQRYFQRWIQPPLRGATSAAVGGSRMGMPFPVPMRAVPTVPAPTGTLTAYDGTTSFNITSIAGSFCTAQTAEFDVTLNVAPANNRPLMLYQLGGAYLDFSAEL